MATPACGIRRPWLARRPPHARLPFYLRAAAAPHPPAGLAPALAATEGVPHGDKPMTLSASCKRGARYFACISGREGSKYPVSWRTRGGGTRGAVLDPRSSGADRRGARTRKEDITVMTRRLWLIAYFSLGMLL